MCALSHLLLLSLVLLKYIYSSPLILWSNEKLPFNFQIDQIADFSTSNILVFTFDKFASTDLVFSKGDDEWVMFLKDKINDPEKFRYYSSLCNQEPLKTLQGLSDQYTTQNISNLKILPEEPKVYFFKLPALLNAREKLGTILNNVITPFEQKKLKYIFIMTGSLEEEYCLGNTVADVDTYQVRKRVARAVTDGRGNSSTPTGHFVNGTCVYLYLKNATFHVTRQRKPRVSETFPLENTLMRIMERPDCTNQKIQQMRVGFTNLPPDLTELSALFNRIAITTYDLGTYMLIIIELFLSAGGFSFTFTKNRWNYWKLANLTTKFVVKSPNNDIRSDMAPMSLPCEVGAYNNRSFVCDRLSTVERPKPKDRNFTALYLDGAQMQAFGVFNSSFGRATDCTGFFSPAIWMGLFSSGVLISVLAFGLSVLLSTKTMDRFDSPKMATSLNLAGGSD